jgi:hypothetical protein
VLSLSLLVSTGSNPKSSDLLFGLAAKHNVDTLRPLSFHVTLTSLEWGLPHDVVCRSVRGSPLTVILTDDGPGRAHTMLEII